MVKWTCSVCGAPGDYHSCVDGVHRYYCDKHWWEYVKLGYVVQDLDNSDEDVGTLGKVRG
jgi:hypothetical protein